MLCDFEEIHNGRILRCKRCGFETRNPNNGLPTYKTCPEEPGKVRKAVNFVKAVVKHGLDGRRKVSGEELQQRLRVCRGCPGDGIPKCEKYIASKDKCSDQSCGCKISMKAQWKSESCPMEKWPV